MSKHAKDHATEHETGGSDAVAITHAQTTGQTADDHHAQSHSHVSHSGIGADDHHAESHSLASHSTKAHSELSSVGPDDHHNAGHTHASHSSIGADDHHAQSHSHASHSSIGADDHHNETHDNAKHSTLYLPQYESLRSGDWVMPGFVTAGIITPNTGDMYAFPFDIFEAIAFKTIGIGQQAAGGAGSLYYLGWYADSGGLPGALIVDQGSVAMDGSNGTKSIAFGPTTLQPGRIWLACVARVGTPSVRSFAGPQSIRARRGSADSLNTSNGPNQGYLRNVAGTGLPNPFGTPDGLTNAMPQIWLQVN